MKIPTMESCMTPSPHTVGDEIPLTQAIHKMREGHIRHLPVLRAGKLVGILSDRDIKLALSVHPTATDLVVSDVMTESVFSVTKDTPLDAATDTMFREKLGCIVVRDRDGTTVGIFTANDAVKILNTLLREGSLERAAHAHAR